MKNLIIAAVALAGYVAAYGYGVASVRFDLFPYDRLAGRIAPDDFIPVSKTHGAKGRELYDRLKQGGYIIYFRHNHRARTQDVRMVDALAYLTEPEIVDPDYDDGLCLTEYGHQQAWYLSRIFEALDLPIDKVVSSPICRCVQTAEGIFGRVDELDYDMIYRTILPFDEREAIHQRRRRTLETPPPPGTNTVIVAHSSPSLHHVGLRIPNLVEGGAAVLKPDGNGEIHFVAILKPQDWIHLMDRKPVWP